MSSMTTWLTSDLHFGHEKVAVEHRGFKNAQEHDDVVIHNWMSRVRDTDVVIVAGDISSGSSTPQRRALDIIYDLPGDKIAVLGNHDSAHPAHGSKSLAWETAYSQVFSSVRTHHFLRHAGTRFIVSHFPFDIDHTDEVRQRLWRFPRVAAGDHVLLHGHTHQSHPWTSRSEVSVGLDAWNFAPVDIGSLTYRFHKQFESANRES